MPRARLNPLAYAHVIREMQHGPSTESEMAESSGLTKRTVHDFMAALERVSAAHVQTWEKDSRGHYRIPVWQLGQGKNATLPVGASGMYHRARKLAAAHGVTTKTALAVLRQVSGHVDKARAHLARQAGAGA